MTHDYPIMSHNWIQKLASKSNRAEEHIGAVAKRARQFGHAMQIFVFIITLIFTGYGEQSIPKEIIK